MPDDFSLYIHYPYCEKKCPYCDFNSHLQSASFDADIFLRCYDLELRRLKTQIGDRQIASIFFGGGTPSLMPERLCAALLERVAALWRLAPDCEITLEANPSSVEMRKLKSFHQSGVNRLSIGVQSFDDAKLKFLGRIHDADAAQRALAAAHEVLSNVSFDLIYACADETLDDWRQELQTALSYQPKHLSCYQLTIEPGTPFHKKAQDGRLTLPDCADFTVMTHETLAARGLPAYEISNHAAPDYQCRHNLTYWLGGDYAGIGPGAHSRLTSSDDGTRNAYDNHKSPQRWQQAMLDGESPAAHHAVLTRYENALEKLLMGLRLTQGVDLARDEYDAVIDETQLHSYRDYVSAASSDDGMNLHLQTTAKGWLFLDSVIAAITRDDAVLTA